MPQLNKNQYAALAGDEENEEMTPKVQEWRTTAQSQECATTMKSQEWIAITRAQG